MTAPGFGVALLDRIEGELAESRAGQRLAGAQLRDAVFACACTFRDAAQRRQGPLMLALDLTFESVLAYLGALASGRTVVPVDAKEWQQKGHELIAMLQPAVCWFPSRMLQMETPACGRTLHGIADVINSVCAGAASRPGIPTGCEGDLVAGARVLVPTSGSTGRPSLVRVTDANLFANTADIVASQRLSGRDKTHLCLPLNYCFGASVLHSHLWAGGSVVVDDRLMFPEKILDAIEAEECTTFAGVPTSFLFLQARSTVLRRKLPKLRLWLQAGGYLPASVVTAFRGAHPNTAFAVMYGQTEATARIASFIVEGEYPHGCVGYPMASLEVDIRSENRTVNGPGAEGDVWIRGASVCAGYFCDSEREAEKFVDGWLNTGDIGYLHEDGRLCITGRSDGFIKIRGRRVSSLEIEDVIWQAFAVRSCACAFPDEASGEVIGLLMESDGGVVSAQHRPSGAGGVGHAITKAGTVMLPGDTQLKERVRSVLPQHWDLGPVMCGELPFTSSGKINRRACFMLLTKAGEERCQ